MAKTLCLAQNPAADRLLTDDPLALLIGMLLDQQIPLEWAFTGPYTLTQRLGHGLDAAEIAAFDPEKLATIFAGPPAIHRYPASMAARVQKLCAGIVADYGGQASEVWTTAKDATELRRRLEALPGFGAQKAKIFLALLGKQLSIRPKGWREVAGDFGAAGSFCSVADIVDGKSLAKVRAYKKEMKAAKAAASTG